jgi:hypothetical protein
MKNMSSDKGAVAMVVNLEMISVRRWLGCGLALVLAASWLCGTHVHAQQQRPKRAVKRAAAKSMLTGSDGSMTGVANFQGNRTTIAAAGNQLVSLAVAPNCSLIFATGTYSKQTGNSDALSGSVTDNYQDILHSEAGLTTTPDVYASGCVPPTTGFGAEQGVFVGTTTSGLNVFAGIAYDPIAMTAGLYVVTTTLNAYLPTGALSSDYSLNVFGFSTASALTAADLNKDGNNDLVVTNSVFTTSGSVSVLLGNADGTFQTAVSYPTAGAGTIAAVIEDVNGDGKLDIVAVSAYQGNSGGVDQQVSVLLGKGDGTFSAAQNFTAPALPEYTDEFATPITNLITASLRGNGKKDLIGNNGQVFLGNGDGTFTASATPAFPYQPDYSSATGPYLASGDLNKDGKLDLVLGNGNISTYFGKGDGTFTVGPTYASIGNYGEVTTSDLDGDGNLDIYNGLANGGVYGGDGDDPNLSYALMGYGNGTFSGAPYVNGTGVYGAYTGTNMGDVNGDGLPDLITLGTTSSNEPTSIFTVQLGTNTGIFNPVSTFTIPASAVVSGTTISGSSLNLMAFAVGDINGDDKADLVFITSGASSLSYSGLLYWTALSNGDGTFATPVPHLMPPLAPAGDNDAGTQTLVGLQLSPLNKGGNAAILFSFYEDTYTTQNVYLEGFMVLPGNGDGTFGTPVTTYTYNSTTTPPILTGVQQVVKVADLNNDNKEDLLTVSHTGGSNSDGDLETILQVYLGKGDGTFASPTTVNSAASINVPQYPDAGSPCVVMDFNKDGKLDLACMGADTSANPEVTISLGNGDGTFAAPTVLQLTGGVGDVQGGIEGGITAADFDGDGNIDLALFDFNSYSGIFYGKGDGTFTSVNTGSGLAPKDLINLAAGGTSIAVDLNGDGKPDILAGSTVLLNDYGTTTPTLATTTTGLVASPSAITAGANVTLTATVTGVTGSTGTPTGTVTFYDGTTMLGTGTLTAGIATYSTTGLPVGSDSVTAVYAGDSNFSGSTSAASLVAVSAIATPVATSTALTASTTTAVTGTSISFTATVTPSSGTTVPTGTVTFLDGTTTLGTGTLNGSGVATYATSSLAVGVHSISGSYGATSSFSASTSTAVSVTINAAIPQSFALSVSPASGTVAEGSATSTTITVTPSGGFNQAVSLTCAGVPTNAACVISPVSVTPKGTTAVTATLAVQAGVATMSARNNSLPTDEKGAVVLLSGTVLLGWTLVRRRRKSWWFVQLGLALVLLASGSVTGCGGSGSGPNKTPPGAYTLTVTGTSGTTTETVSYNLTVK